MTNKKRKKRMKAKVRMKNGRMKNKSNRINPHRKKKKKNVKTKKGIIDYINK